MRIRRFLGNAATLLALLAGLLVWAKLPALGVLVDAPAFAH